MSHDKAHRYLTDDRDAKNRFELEVTHADNGDYYLAVVPEGKRSFDAVRISTSGGCAAENPRLLKATREMFEALGGWNASTASSPNKNENKRHGERAPEQAALPLELLRSDDLSREDINALWEVGVNMDDTDFLLIVPADCVTQASESTFSGYNVADDSPFYPCGPFAHTLDRIVNGVYKNYWYRVPFRGRDIGLGVSYHG